MLKNSLYVGVALMAAFLIRVASVQLSAEKPAAEEDEVEAQITPRKVNKRRPASVDVPKPRMQPHRERAERAPRMVQNFEPRAEEPVEEERMAVGGGQEEAPVPMSVGSYSADATYVPSSNRGGGSRSVASGSRVGSVSNAPTTSASGSKTTGSSQFGGITGSLGGGGGVSFGNIGFTTGSSLSTTGSTSSGSNSTTGSTTSGTTDSTTSGTTGTTASGSTTSSTSSGSSSGSSSSGSSTGSTTSGTTSSGTTTSGTSTGTTTGGTTTSGTTTSGTTTSGSGSGSVAGGWVTVAGASAGSTSGSTSGTTTSTTTSGTGGTTTSGTGGTTTSGTTTSGTGGTTTSGTTTSGTGGTTTSGTPPVAPTCTATPGTGAYSSSVSVTITCDAPSDIYYCVSNAACSSGTTCDPEASGMAYSSPVTIGATDGNYCLSFYGTATSSGLDSTITDLSYDINSALPHLEVTNTKTYFQTTELYGREDNIPSNIWTSIVSNDFAPTGISVGMVNLKTHDPAATTCEDVVTNYVSYPAPSPDPFFEWITGVDPETGSLSPSSQIDLPLVLAKLDYGDNFVVTWIRNSSYTPATYSCSTTKVHLEDFDYFQADSSHGDTGTQYVREFSGGFTAYGFFEPTIDNPPSRGPAGESAEDNSGERLESGLFSIFY